MSAARIVSDRGVCCVRVTADELPEWIPESWASLYTETDLPSAVAVDWEAQLTARNELTLVSSQGLRVARIQFPSAHQEDFLLALRRWGHITLLLCGFDGENWDDAHRGVQIPGRDIRGY